MSSASIDVGDEALVRIDAYEEESGIICHIGDDNSLFINSSTGSKRIRVLAEDISKSVKINKKASEIERSILSSTDLQSYISQITESNGTNYHIIGGHYECGLDGFPIDFERAMKWYSSGHLLQNIHCTVALAYIYADYYHNYDEAEKYYNVGIDNGYKYCAFAANCMFRNVKNGKNKELLYIKKYVELTNERDCSGLLSLGVCQLTMDVPNYSDAYLYFQKAYKLKKTSIGIQQFLAFLLYRGLGCDKDENKAIQIHKKFAMEKQSECSKLWVAVYNAIDDNNLSGNIHPLTDKLYDSFMDVIKNGDSHGLYYGNWVKIVEFHALKFTDNMSCCLLIALKIFGFLRYTTNINDAKKYINGLMKIQSDCIWIKSWIWFFNQRYDIIKDVSTMHQGLIDVITEMELSICLV